MGTPRALQLLGTFPSSSATVKFDAVYAGQLVYIGEDGSLTPLALGDGLKITDGSIALNIATSSTAESSITTTVDSDGVFRVYKDNNEVLPEVDDNGAISWSGITVTVDSNGILTFAA